MNASIVIVGAGMLGVSCALELQRRGLRVTLVDRSAPGRETSYGNAGVLARSSLIPFNNPTLWQSLPRLVRNRSVQFRYNPRFVLRNAGWATAFLARARQAHFEQTTQALDALIRASMPLHRQWMADAGVAHRLRETGWLFGYRSAGAFDGAALSRETFARFGIATEVLDAAGLRELEPSLRPVFERALWIKDTCSVDNPGKIVEAYAALFAARGGEIVRGDVSRLWRDAVGDSGDTGGDARDSGGDARVAAGWRVELADGRSLAAGRVVVALGPWSREFLERQLSMKVPMVFERGYHMHYHAEAGAQLGRPLYDTGGGYVLSPMEQGFRLSTGVELDDLDAPADHAQLDLAETAARQAFPIAGRREGTPWRGGRPTLPDSRPAIGAAPGHPGLWLAFGHQHIGFSTGPGSAALLGALMAGDAPPVDPLPFAPGRFVR